MPNEQITTDDRPVSVVTGANSGIGRATAIHLAKQGHRVIGTVRSLDKAEKVRNMAANADVSVELFELDVADDESVRAGFGRILEATGRVDHLVNNAGVGGNAVAEECPPEMYLPVMNVNLCGAVRCIQAVLPQMRERGSGTIVNITSVAGRIAALAQSPYVASKWAFEGLSEGLAQELAPFGIRVAIIEPGVTKSAIFAKNIDAPNSTGAYDAHYRRMFQFYMTGMANATDPFEVAEVIHQAITSDEHRLRYPVSWGGAELAELHDRIDDVDWIAMGAIEEDDEYYRTFHDVMLDERLGEGAVQIRSSGFGPVDLPPIDDAVDAMRRRGLDVSAHRSSTTTAVLVDGADLVLTAERGHVVKIAALSPDAFRRALTLPEFLAVAATSGHDDDDVDVRSWVEALTEERTAGAYLREAVPEVADPTGSMPRAFEVAVNAIEQQCREVTSHLVMRLRARPQ